MALRPFRRIRRRAKRDTHLDASTNQKHAPNWASRILNCAGSLGAFTFLVEHSVAPTNILIENTSAAATADVILAGLIENPTGTTTIRSAGGDIISNGPAAIVRTAKATLEAEAGTVGTIASRVNVELVKSAGRTTDLAIDEADRIASCRN